MGHENYGRYRARARAIPELHVARTHRSRGRNYAVEFSAATRVVENRAGFGSGKHGCTEASAINFTFRVTLGRNLPGSRIARWRAEHPDRIRKSSRPRTGHSSWCG